jgi:hypothetical protein
MEAYYDKIKIKDIVWYTENGYIAVYVLVGSIRDLPLMTIARLRRHC